MAVIVNDMELPKDCMKCPLDNYLICKVSHGLCTSEYRPSHCPLKSVEGLIKKMKEHCKYDNKDKLSDYSIDLDEAIDIIEEYCEVR